MELTIIPNPIDISAINTMRPGNANAHKLILGNKPIMVMNTSINNNLIPNWNKLDAVIESGTIALGK
jgi:hypothetical protein